MSQTWLLSYRDKWNMITCKGVTNTTVLRTIFFKFSPSKVNVLASLRTSIAEFVHMSEHLYINWSIRKSSVTWSYIGHFPWNVVQPACERRRPYRDRIWSHQRRRVRRRYWTEDKQLPLRICQIHQQPCTYSVGNEYRTHKNHLTRQQNDDTR